MRNENMMHSLNTDFAGQGSKHTGKDSRSTRIQQDSHPIADHHELIGVNDIPGAVGILSERKLVMIVIIVGGDALHALFLSLPSVISAMLSSVARRLSAWPLRSAERTTVFTLSPISRSIST
ncbi:MAG: hypothetical protein FD153_206 [Rhodospirillaceae bacterium]|nr:MAG: hypothetical protein FD153_206 [Rhodospirillaceae bacterium]